ncbi:unnamed protein product [Brassicogethes aeneus]|uniref:MADF domain-containing protein n=1 Tax=Brassicogethes aeneus TaxID=1431903 RepID=A0A9P0B0M9_BRAAE|nr:unnamed protein product [Brassicogethes aeneus]
MGKLYLIPFFVDQQMKFDRKLIILIKKYPELYDKNHEDFYNKDVKNGKWNIIAKQLNFKERKLEKRFEELVQKYNEEKQWVCNNTPIYRQWPLLGEMQYFNEYNLDFHNAEPHLEEHTHFLEKFIKKMHDIKI